jgi:cyclohexyl-isocyanide hydratase
MSDAPLLQPGDPFRVAMLVFPKITQLDLTGPHEVFTRVRGVEAVTVWKNRESLRSASGLMLVPDRTYAECTSADLLCVPGGPGHIDLLHDAETLDWLRQIAAHARFVTSVCTGAIVLGAAGLLRGYRATTHWGSMETLPILGAIPVNERVVWDRNRVTGGGVTAGIDFALQILAHVWGERAAQLAQLSMEYDPAPPFNAGSPASAPADMVERMRDLMHDYRQKSADAARQAAAAFPPL